MNTNHAASVLGVSLATLSPALALPLWLGLYVMLKQAKAYALFGAVMPYFGMTIAFVHEVLRIALFARLPPAYAAASEVARPAILVLGDLFSMRSKCSTSSRSSWYLGWAVPRSPLRSSAFASSQAGGDGSCSCWR